jgi:hypothetical protein
VVPKAGFRCSTTRIGLILQGNSDARVVLAPKTPCELDYRSEINELRSRTV